MRSRFPSSWTRRAFALRPSHRQLSLLCTAQLALPATLIGRLLDPDGRAVPGREWSSRIGRAVAGNPDRIFW